MSDLKLVLGISIAIVATLGTITPSVSATIGPPHSGACGAGDSMETPGGNLCLPDEGGDNAPNDVPEEKCHPDSAPHGCF